MRRRLLLLTWLLALVGCGAPKAEDEERHFVGNLVNGMRQTLAMHAEFRGRRPDQLTEDERDYLRHDLVDLQSRRTGLEMSLPKLTGRHKAEDERVLAAFLARWSWDGLADGLYASPSARDGLDADVRRLVERFPMNTWRSPFARFPNVR
jgi:hypothetical protein